MPTYEFLNTKTQEQFEVIMRISERETYLKENPHIQPVVSAPMIVSGVSVRDKVPSGFKEVLSKVAEAHPSSTVGRRHGRKSIKAARTEQVVKKHVEKYVKRSKE
jgi:hypothetical protein